MSRFRPNRPDPRPDSGAAAVEFALVLIPLLLLVMGIINFGAVFNQQLTLNNAVRQGAREAVVSGSSTAGTGRTCAGVVSNVRASSGTGLGIQDVAASGVNVRTTRTTGTPCGTGFNSPSNAVVCANSLNPATGSFASVIVEAEYASRWLVPMPLPIPAFANGPTLKAKAVYRCEAT